MADQKTEAEVMDALGQMVAEINSRNATAAATGSCIVTLPNSVQCFNGFTKENCDRIKGVFTSGGKCP